MAVQSGARDKIVHLHIEKVGGTTVQSKYIKKYGEDVWGYSASEGCYRSYSKKLFDITSKRQQKVRAFLFREMPRVAQIGQWVLNMLPSHVALSAGQVQHVAQVVMGHFTFGDVAGAFDPKEWAYRTVLRHPLDRMLSHYYYLPQRAVPSSRMRLPALSAEGVSFEEFALLPAVQNYQVQAVGLHVEAYACIGVMDYLDAFLAETGLQPPGYVAPVINKGTRRMNPDLSPSFVREFEEFHAKDYELYERTLEIWR